MKLSHDIVNKVVESLLKSKNQYKGSDILKMVKKTIVEEYDDDISLNNLLDGLKESIVPDKSYSYDDAYSKIYYAFGGDNKIAASALSN